MSAIRALVIVAVCAASPAFVGCDKSGSSKKIRSANSVTRYPAEGGVVISMARRKNNSKKGKKTICVAPPAQVGLSSEQANKLAAAFGKGKDLSAAVEVMRSTKAGPVALHEHNIQSLFLQYAFYRLCEAEMNNVLGKEGIQEVLVRQRLRLFESSERTREELSSLRKSSKKYFGQTDQQCQNLALGVCTSKCTTARTACETENSCASKRKSLKAIEKCKGCVAAENVCSGECGTSSSVSQSAAECRQVSARADELQASLKRATDLDAAYVRVANLAGNKEVSGFWRGFSDVLSTSVRLAEIDAEKEEARAARVKAEATKATLAAAKDKSKAELDPDLAQKKESQREFV